MVATHPPLTNQSSPTVILILRHLPFKMPNPGISHGPWKKWLNEQLERYGKVVDMNIAVEYIQATQSHFLAHWPITLLSDTEQSNKLLASMDNNAPTEEPDLSSLSEEEQESLLNDLKVRKAVSQLVASSLGLLMFLMCSSANSTLPC